MYTTSYSPQQQQQQQHRLLTRIPEHPHLHQLQLLPSAPPPPPAYHESTEKSLSSTTTITTTTVPQYNDGSRRFKGAEHFPSGIVREFHTSAKQFPLRLWILDNSGSMATTDGIIFKLNGTSNKRIPCSRWTELGSAVKWHAETSLELNVTTEFQLINSTGSCQQTGIVGGGESRTQSMQQVQALISSTPTKRTPLCSAIRRVVTRVQSIEPMLRASNQRVVVVIASDGVSTDGDVAQALAPLQQLPVWVVIRLCTNDQSVVDYWNNIDDDLELDIDVLDDLEQEAAEITKVNKWVTYGQPLHRLREWGTSNKALDHLDEYRLAPNEITQFLHLLLDLDTNVSTQDWHDWITMISTVQTSLDQEPLVWNPVTKKNCQWIKIKSLKNALKVKSNKANRGYKVSHCECTIA